MTPNPTSGSNNNKQTNGASTNNNSIDVIMTPTAKEEPAAAETVTEQLSKSLNAAPTVAEQSEVATGDMEAYKPPPGKKAKKKGNTKNHSVAGCSNLEPEIKRLKQRRINVAGAPKMPLNGYVRFMNDRREELRREWPQRTALEHTKMIGEEWQQLPDERKAPYLESAARDKAIYHETLQKFLKEHPEIVASMDQKNNSAQKEKQVNNNKNGVAKKTKAVEIKPQRAPSPDPDDIPLSQVKRTPTPQSAPSVQRACAAGEIPIFTNEFLEHNRNLEVELRTLRKTKADLEQQNAVLEQHVENTMAGRAKVLSEVAELKEENTRLETYMLELRKKVVEVLAGVALPPLDPNGPNEQNIDKYIDHLVGLTSSNSSSSSAAGQNNALLLRAREALRKLDSDGS